MRSFLVCLLLFLVPISVFSFNNQVQSSQDDLSECQRLYDEMNLDGVVNYSAFEQIFEGYKKLGLKDKKILTLIDFSKPSTEKRLYIFDVKNKKLIFTSFVAHGRNSGDNYATSFSNKTGSAKSSLGFYLTGNVYNSRKNGYSLILNGLEEGINNNARDRSIVIHGASYANPSFISSSGRLGRSLGCPALPQDVNDMVIDIIKDGTLLYIYANNRNYISQSPVLSKKFDNTF